MGTHRDWLYGRFRGICPWIMWYCDQILTLNTRLTDQSAILIPCAEATDEQVRKEIHRNCRPPPSWVTSINQEVIHRIRLSNLRIGDISISPILICFSLSDWQRKTSKVYIKYEVRGKSQPKIDVLRCWYRLAACPPPLKRVLPVFCTIDIPLFLTS